MSRPPSAPVVDNPSKRIEPSRRPEDPLPNLSDYERARAGFSWEAAREALDGLPGGHGLNIAHEAVAGTRPGRERTSSPFAGWDATGRGATSPIASLPR